MLNPARFFLPLAVLATMVCATASADTITLTSGEKVEGKVVGETATEITVSVKVSAAVTDERVIPKNTVAKIDKEQPDEITWQALKNLKLGANSFPAAQYDPVLRPLQGFVNEYPKSEHAAAASTLLADFAGEKQRVEAGEVRLGEKWLSADEVSKERYQINGLLAVQYMKSQRAAGDLTGALNSFDQIEKTYPGAKNFPDGVEAARETLAALKSTIDRAKQMFATRKAEFEAGFVASSALQKPQLLAARQKELAQGEAALAAATAAKVKWPTLVTSSDKNMETIEKKIPTELQRLASLDVAKLRQSVQLAEQGQKELAEQKPEAADSFAKALAIWTKNELAARLKPEAEALKIAATTAAAKAATAAAKVVAATPVPATPTPRPVTVNMPQTEAEKPFFLTIGGIITIVVILALLLGGWTAFKKIKGKGSDVLE